MADVQVGLGGVVGKVGGAGSPVEAKSPLRFLAVEPPKAHVPGFHFFSNDGLVGNTQGSGVVSLDWRLWLWPAHFNEELSKGDHFFGTDEEA